MRAEVVRRRARLEAPRVPAHRASPQTHPQTHPRTPRSFPLRPGAPRRGARPGPVGTIRATHQQRQPARAAPAHEAAVEAKSPGSPRPYGQIHTFARPRSRDGRRHARPLLVRRRRAHLPEAPVPVVRVNRTEERLRGAANVALNIAGVGAASTLLSVVGDDEARPHDRQAVARIGDPPPNSSSIRVTRRR